MKQLSFEPTLSSNIFCDIPNRMFSLTPIASESGIMFSVPVFLVVMTVINQGLSENVYVVTDFPFIPCIDNPAKDICPIDHKIPDLSKIPEAGETVGNKTFIKSILDETLGMMKHVNENCKDALKGYFCTALLPPCKDSDDNIIMNGKPTVDACIKFLQECGAGFSSVANCSVLPKKVPRRMACGDLPVVKNNPYPCPKINYKVPERSKEQLLRTLFSAHKLLKKEEGKLDEKCSKNVADTICKLSRPACTWDRKHLVTFLSRQECEKNAKCLNVTDIDPELPKGAKEMCQNLPDGNTARKLDSSSVLPPDSKATGQSKASKILVFVFLSFVSLGVLI